MVTAYFYVNLNTKGKYTVIKSTAKDMFIADRKARQWASQQGWTMPGGYFNANCLPYNFQDAYDVITLPKGFKGKKEEPDFIDRLISYENGEMTSQEESDFLKEIKNKKIANKLQGHYGRRI